jgi:hypothetical protein
MVAPHADGFLAAVQRYVLKKGTYDPEEGSPAWIMVQLFRPGVETAIERAENYNRRLCKARQRMFDSPGAVQAGAASSADVTNAQKVDNASGTQTSATHFGFTSRRRETIVFFWLNEAGHGVAGRPRYRLNGFGCGSTDVGTASEFRSATPSSLRNVAFDVGLHLPSDALYEPLLVASVGRLAPCLLILFSQLPNRHALKQSDLFVDIDLH